MELPVVIDPLPDQRGFSARLATPFDLVVEAATADEAYRQLAALLQQRLQQGPEVRTLTIPVTASSGVNTGWLPDDELTQEWLQFIEQYRTECDAADQKLLLGEPDQEKQP